MDTLDKFEQLIQQSSIAALVLGHGDLFSLAFLEPDGSLSPADTFLPSLLGFRLCGVLALVDGHTQWETEPDADAFHLVIKASKVFAFHPRVEGTEYLEKLYALEDPRA